MCQEQCYAHVAWGEKAPLGLWVLAGGHTLTVLGNTRSLSLSLPFARKISVWLLTFTSFPLDAEHLCSLTPTRLPNLSTPQTHGE